MCEMVTMAGHFTGTELKQSNMNYKSKQYKPIIVIVALFICIPLHMSDPSLIHLLNHEATQLHFPISQHLNIAAHIFR